MFANAETLFYYARHVRPTSKLLSPEEIHALLAQTKEASPTNVTEVNPSPHIPTRQESCLQYEGKEGDWFATPEPSQANWALDAESQNENSFANIGEP